MSSAAPEISFTNVGRRRWWQTGLLASQTGYVVIALVLLIIAMSFASANFMTPGNLSNIAKNFSFIAIAALGMTLVIITGGIDLSVGSMIAVGAMVCAMTMTALSAPDGAFAWLLLRAEGTKVVATVPGLIMTLSVLAGLGSGVVAGLVNGWLVAYVRLSPFVVTLGMLSVLRGLGYFITNGRGAFPSGPDADLFYFLTSGEIHGIPISFIYVVVLGLLMTLVLHHTAWGRHVFAIGGNEKAAELTGVAVPRVKMQVYVICAVAAALNGIIMSGWLGSAPANMATSYELNVIAASVIGGANLAGGSGGALGAIVGCILLEVIRNGLVLAGANPYLQIVFVGLILIAAVLVEKLRSRIT